MSRGNKDKDTTTQNKSNKVSVDGVVVENLQDTNYLVEIEMQGIKHRLSAYPSGKMRSNYKGRIMLGDQVTVEIDVPYIDKGRITWNYGRNRTRQPYNQTVAAKS